MKTKLINYLQLVLLLVVFSFGSISANSEKDRVFDYLKESFSWILNPRTIDEIRANVKTSSEIKPYIQKKNEEIAKKYEFQSLKQVDSLVSIYEKEGIMEKFYKETLGREKMLKYHQEIEKLKKELNEKESINK